METLPDIWFNSDHPGWHTLRVERSWPSATQWLFNYRLIVSWINDNLESPRKHCRWCVEPDHAEFSFRYERDYLRFILRWG
jgi:hypothetical protein